MWRSLWRSIDRYSLQHFKYVIHELRRIKVVDQQNREIIIDLLQSIVDIVTYGDRHDPMIFECFMEYQVLADFVRVLKISRNSRIEAPLLQYLSIVIQNMQSEHGIYYCLSNDYINSIIEHQYNFNVGDLALYYVSFLRAVSSKVNRDTLCLLVKVHEDAVVSFPLYSEALKFAQHGEKMIQTAIRALTLSIYNVSDDMVYEFLTTPPASNYFKELVHGLGKQCSYLDSLVQSAKEKSFNERTNDLFLATDKMTDDLYYLKDVMLVGDSRLSKVVTQNLLSLLILPLLFPLLHSGEINGRSESVVTCLYVISRAIQIVGGENLINAVACLVLYPYMDFNSEDATIGDTTDGCRLADSFLNLLDGRNMSDININHLMGEFLEHLSSDFQSDVNFGTYGVYAKRSGILGHMFSDCPIISMASLFLFLFLAESKDSFIQENQVHENITLKALLKILRSESSISSQIRWHTGWFLQKLLMFHRQMPSGDNLRLLNTSYQQSCELFRKELNGCWFDHIPDTIRKEWGSCKRALEEPSRAKDPFFLLELAVSQKSVNGNPASSHFAWQNMVDAVKVFVIQVQLRAYMLNGCLPEKSFLKPWRCPNSDNGNTHSSDLSCASFGSEVPLGSGVPCRIAFSNAGIRDVYLIPVSREIYGKLILAEKHPFRSRRGVVLAIAPLAGLSPKIDDDRPSWLHLRIREYDPKFALARSNSLRGSNPATDGRWTLGFSTEEACRAARSSILEETRKQRSFIESVVEPLFSVNHAELQFNSQGA